MPSTPRFLDKLINMTAIHDLELLEFSLLKTLEEFLQTQQLIILKFDRKCHPCFQLKLSRNKYEITWEDIELSENIENGIEIVRRTEEPFSRELSENERLTIWYIVNEKLRETFLVTTTEKEIGDMNTYMINGLLKIYRNFYTVVSEAQKDQLTGLANRRAFDDIINKIYVNRPLATDDVSVERRVITCGKKDIFWLGMVDLDNFKRINDTWGHLYGDEVLLLTSQLMQGHFRENDYLFRFGGEEFVIILRTVDEKHAFQAFERFRKAFAEFSFPQVGQVTISIGVAKMDPSIFTATLLENADRAMYFAKQNGRNQVHIFEKLVRNGFLEVAEPISGEIELF